MFLRPCIVDNVFVCVLCVAGGQPGQGNPSCLTSGTACDLRVTSGRLSTGLKQTSSHPPYECAHALCIFEWKPKHTHTYDLEIWQNLWVHWVWNQNHSQDTLACQGYCPIVVQQAHHYVLITVETPWAADWYCDNACTWKQEGAHRLGWQHLGVGFICTNPGQPLISNTAGITHSTQP